MPEQNNKPEIASRKGKQMISKLNEKKQPINTLLKAVKIPGNRTSWKKSLNIFKY